LDLITREWLEGYINVNIENLIVISHDRYFLNKVVEKVWDLENKNIKEWNYGFKEYFDRKKEYLKNLEKKYRDAMKEKFLVISKDMKGEKLKGMSTMAMTIEKYLEKKE